MMLGKKFQLLVDLHYTNQKNALIKTSSQGRARAPGTQENRQPSILPNRGEYDLGTMGFYQGVLLYGSLMDPKGQ